MNNLSTISKYDWEEIVRNIPFSGLLAEGDTIASIDSVTSVQLEGTSASLTISLTSHDATNVQARYAAGASGDKYRIKAKVVTTAGEHLERDVVLQIN